MNNICQPPIGSGLSCNPATGNVDCYANPSALWSSGNLVSLLYYDYPAPYTPRGNYGLNQQTAPFVPYPVLPSTIPSGTTPPIQPNICTNHQQCTTNSCEIYPSPLSINSCGNYNTIYESQPFGGYYLPPFNCPNAYYYSVYTEVFTPSGGGGGPGPDFIEEPSKEIKDYVES